MRYVALLRGINVGGNRPLKMADLRAIFERAGATDVATYIQSGNVAFAHRSRAPAALLAAAIRDATGMDVPVIVRTAREMVSVAPRNPFAGVPSSEVHVLFLAAKPTPVTLASAPTESYRFDGRELYLHLPAGVGRSKLAAAAGKLGGTLRNWRTIEALAALATATD